jgi:SSS family solute:Na+ symporter
MVALDYLVIAGYFAIMIAIGFIASRRIKKQDDYFMGGRSFGKLLQTFAAFGAGTGSSDPVNTGRATFVSGMSGMWSVMYWLFVTPFYWFTAVWYRRMRHTTLGDWFVERYQSRPLGVAYVIFGLTFFMVYGSMLFSAIGKVASPLMGTDTVTIMGATFAIEQVLVPIIGIVVLLYGVAGGLEAAYYTDLIQGLCIILLSIILVPFGLQALVDQFGNPETDTMIDGFRILHERVPKEYFNVVGSGNSSEFPLHRILAVVLINLIGVAVQPHFIATGGGTAKTEWNARIGLVTGNFLKRFCTVGWVLTALIALALFADHPELLADPEKTWGIASRELLGPGLTGLMLACLLAALMSSVDAYMVVGSALVVRNIYVPYINPDAGEATCLKIGRWTGAGIVAGAVIISLAIMDVFKQLQLTWVLGVVFAAPFWMGMLWRRTTKIAAWSSVLFCVVVFGIAPTLAPIVWPEMRNDSGYAMVNDRVRTTSSRDAAPSDVSKRAAQIKRWEEQSAEVGKLADAEERSAAEKKLGAKPEPLEVGGSVVTVTQTGGQGVFWANGVKPKDDSAELIVVEESTKDGIKTERLRYPDKTALVGNGSFRADFVVYRWAGIDMTKFTDATLATMDLPVKILAPFLVIILISLITPMDRSEAVNRYFIKMKTPVIPNPEEDEKSLAHAYAHPDEAEAKKWFPGTNIEIQKPNKVDIIGFIVCLAICFAVIGLAVLVAGIGG